MTPELAILPTMEMGSLRAEAYFQDPDVQITRSRDDDPALQLEEAGIVMVLSFVDRESLRRFLYRLSHLSLPRCD